MGKAAKRARAKTRKYLKNIAQKDLRRFEMELEKRIPSWMSEIEKRAGKLSNDKGEKVRPVFDVLDGVMEILQACGEEIFKNYAEKTFALLSGHCCAALAKEGVPQLYRLSNVRSLERCHLYDVRHNRPFETA